MSTFFSTITLPGKTQFSATSLISHLKLLCSFTLSHPLYFSFAIFFFPYLLKLLSFLSPLFITTFLLLLVALLTLSPGVIIRDKFLAESDKVSTLLSVSFDGESESEELFHLENFEENRILFEESLTRVRESRADFLEEKSADQPEKDSAAAMKERRLEDFMKEVENMAFGYYNGEDENKVEGGGAKADKVVETQKENSPIRNGSKEREWKRTLACKLYEERNQAMDASGEGMDLLWETYEMDTAKNEGKQDDDSEKKMKQCENDSDEEEEEEMDEKLCCLQALKLSAGKMNSGIGKPNLMKISKAIKRFGWLQNVSKHSKKVHSGDIHIQKNVSTTT